MFVNLCVFASALCSHKHAICRRSRAYGRVCSARTWSRSSGYTRDRCTGTASSCGGSGSRAACSPTAARTPSRTYAHTRSRALLLAHVRLVARVDVLLVQVQPVLRAEHLVAPAEVAAELPLARRVRLPVLVQPRGGDEACVAAGLLALVQLPVLRVLHLVAAQRQLRGEPLAAPAQRQAYGSTPSSTGGSGLRDRTAPGSIWRG